MNTIEQCKQDLEKLIGSPVTITVRHPNRQGHPEPLTLDNLYYVKSYGPAVTSFLVETAAKVCTQCGETAAAGKPVWVSSFSLQQLTGCCGVLVSTGSSVNANFQRKGVATRLNQLRKDIAQYLNYSIMLCTDVDSNEAQRRVLEKNGWQDVYQFTNRRTNNLLNISVCPIEPKS